MTYQPTFLFAVLLTAVLPITGACGDDGDPGAVVDGGPDADDGLPPPPDGQGVQFRMNTTISAGVEAEHCRFVQASDEAMFVNRDEVRYGAGSHHFLLYETSYDSIPTVNDDGRPIDTSGVFDCSDGPTDGWSVTKLVGGSQNSNGASILSFPDDVALEVRGGAVLLMNAHYINASDTDLDIEVRVNLHTIDESSVRERGDVLFLYNPLIGVKANATSRARWRCPVHQEITISNAQSHMHARGVGYSASVMGSEAFYQNDKWEDVPVSLFEPGLNVPAGSMLEYHCDFVNTESQDIYQGPRSTDEMCMLIGSFYPADARIANCLDETGEGIGGEWVGSGAATCAQTLSCLETAFSLGLNEITDCVLASDATVATEVSDLLRCAFNNNDPGVNCAAQIETCSQI